MSRKSVKSFFEKMVMDDAFAKQIAKCKDTEERIALARSAGFDVDREEIIVCGVEVPLEELTGLLEG